MARTIKHQNACGRPRCGMCHPWKRKVGGRGTSKDEKYRPSERRRIQEDAA